HPRLSCKIEYLTSSNHSDKSIASEFFTDDQISCRVTKSYRPNSRSISQPSNPAAACGRTEPRAGGGRFGPPAGSGTGGAGACADGALTCEATCARLPNGPDP